MKDIHSFLCSPAESTHRHGPHDRIVISSRVRLARNIRNAPFPGWAKKPDRVKALEIIQPAISALPQMGDSFAEAMDNFTQLDKQILVERHLISREHAAKSAGSGLVLNRDEWGAAWIAAHRAQQAREKAAARENAEAAAQAQPGAT